MVIGDYACLSPCGPSGGDGNMSITDLQAPIISCTCCPMGNSTVVVSPALTVKLMLPPIVISGSSEPLELLLSGPTSMKICPKSGGRGPVNGMDVNVGAPRFDPAEADWPFES